MNPGAETLPGFRISGAMATRPQTFRPWGSRSKAESHRECDERRGSARSRGYDGRWDKARRAFLSEHPLCVMCQREGRVEPATVVDHIVPHRGDPRLFWDEANWQPLCKRHHDRDKQSQERRDGL